MPEELPPELAALTEIVAVTHGLDSAPEFRFGDSVLVLGAGPLGLLHLVKADLLGAGRLMAVDVFASRLEAARGFGADVLLDASGDHRRGAAGGRARGDGRLRRRRRRPQTGVATTFPEALALVRPGGTVIEPGTFVDMGDVPVNPSRDIVTRSITIIGIGGETLPQYAPALRMLERHGERLARAAGLAPGRARGRRRRARAGAVARRGEGPRVSRAMMCARSSEMEALRCD